MTHEFLVDFGHSTNQYLKDIKRAYAKQSKVYHPEDDPENFQRLQKAYQEALAWQKSHSGNEENSAVIGHKQLMVAWLDGVCLSARSFL